MRAIVITCFGDNSYYYQDGVASAKTYRYLNPDHEVYMTFDEERCPKSFPRELNDQGIQAVGITRAGFELVHDLFLNGFQVLRFWKINIWFHILKMLQRESCLFVDGDTVCIRPLAFSREILDGVKAGKIYAASDFTPLWVNDLADPKCFAYVPPEKRKQYINSGVVLASRPSLEIFSKLLVQLQVGYFNTYNNGECGDQTALNYMLNVECPDRFGLLGNEYNSIGGRMGDISAAKIIHWTGTRVKVRNCHEKLTEAVLKGYVPRTYDELFPGNTQQ
jgi:hypothetical protein